MNRLALPLLAALAGCASTNPATVAATACPVPMAYTPAFERQVQAEVGALHLPDGDPLITWIDDYATERAKLRACAKP